MRSTVFLFLLLLTASAFGSSPVKVDSATAHVRSYQYSFLNGNLAANWSFESDSYFWSSAPRLNRSALLSRCGKSCQPVTGSYAMVVVDGGATQYAGESDLIPVDGGQTYSLSQFVLAEESNGAHPEVWFYSDNATVIQKVPGRSYSEDGRWVLHKDVFTAPAASRFAKIVLYAESGSARAYILIDDVIFEKGSAASDRSTAGMSIGYADGLGRGYQSQTLLRREWASELVPSECMNGFVVHGNSLSRVGSRAKVSGGNIGSDDSLFVDNDVALPYPSGGYTLLRADGGIRMGDRAQVAGEAEYGHALSLGNQSSVSGTRKHVAGSSCPVPVRNFSAGVSDVYVNNDQDFVLPPGNYKDAMFRARSDVFLKAGDYYFKSFHLEPQAVLHFDLSGGNVRIFVKDELRIDDNTAFVYSASGNNFIGWYTGQSSLLRLGTISNLSGVFVAPNARLELGHQSTLKGAMYAKEVYVMEDATLAAPSFLFHDPRLVMAVGGTSYDGQGRMARGELSFPAEMSSEGLAASTLDHAKDYYSAVGDGADAKGYPYAEPVYSAQDGRALEQGSPGADWRVGSGHTSAGDRFFVNSLDIPSTLGAGDSVEALYSLSWSRDAQGSSSLAWSDRLGRTVQSASSIGGTGTDLSQWKWSVTRYEYTVEGRLLRTLTPLDVANGGVDFSVVASYDASGRVVAKYGPDRGLEKFWYAVDGSQRLTQTEEQRKRNAYSYVDYDAQGRQHSSGETVLAGRTDAQLWAIAESGSPVPGTRTEYSGVAYDNLDRCVAGIGIQGLSKWLDTLSLENTRGRRTCSWTRNPKAAVALSAERALVADFSSYDPRGRLVRTYRYTGSLSDVSQRLRSLEYGYDQLDRMDYVTYRDGHGTELARSDYHYDEKGRVSSITGKDGGKVVSFGYTEMGELVHAWLGADVRLDYEYHLHGQVKSIVAVRVSTGAVLYSQNLGYEEKVTAGTATPRYDGLIAQNLVTFAQDVAQSPERLAAYDYDGLGRLVEKNGTDGAFAMDYDLNGRVMRQENGSEALTYEYNEGSYRPDHVTGTTPLAPGRDMSIDGNFQWDANGRMVYDASRDLLIDYDATGLPTEMRRLDLSDTLGGRSFAQTQLYGPDGQRTATFDWLDSAGSRRLVGVRSDVMLGGRKRGEVWETYDADSGRIVAVSEYTMIQGRSGIVGRVRPDGLAEWYVKDHQGSLALSVVGNGYGTAFAYHPYGAQNLLRTDGQPPAEQYTGKEWDGKYEFYYYGARFMDPVLGMWVVPDPAEEYFNPYGSSNNPINVADPDGRCELVCITIIAVAAIVGAYAGGAAANEGEYNPTEWDYDSQTYTYMALGGVIGAASAATGGAIGGAITGSLSSTALGTTLATGIGNIAGGAVAGAMAGAGNAYAFGGVQNGEGLFSGSLSQVSDAATNGAMWGAIGGGFQTVGQGLSVYTSSVAQANGFTGILASGANIASSGIKYMGATAAGILYETNNIQTNVNMPKVPYFKMPKLKNYYGPTNKDKPTYEIDSEEEIVVDDGLDDDNGYQDEENWWEVTGKLLIDKPIVFY